VAEAVETAEQVEVLREVGVEIGQGYFFSAPMTAAAAADLAAMVPHPRFALAVPAMH
jgi:EAL domain-containing protein (putative c-di-GMP-specific phosphodiesterase class I)